MRIRSNKHSLFVNGGRKMATNQTKSYVVHIVLSLVKKDSV